MRRQVTQCMPCRRPIDGSFLHNLKPITIMFTALSMTAVLSASESYLPIAQKLYEDYYDTMPGSRAQTHETQIYRF